MIPLFKVFGSISNSGALWQPAQPNPPEVRTPLVLKTGDDKNKFLPWFSCAVKLEKGCPSLVAKALPASYLESNDWILLINCAKALWILVSVYHKQI